MSQIVQYAEMALLLLNCTYESPVQTVLHKHGWKKFPESCLAHKIQEHRLHCKSHHGSKSPYATSVCSMRLPFYFEPIWTCSNTLNSSRIRSLGFRHGLRTPEHVRREQSLGNREAQLHCGVYKLLIFWFKKGLLIKITQQLTVTRVKSCFLCI